MLGESPVTIVHGPPGTGKRTVITKAAQLWGKGRSPVCIAAQSNTAVKNITEKLFKKGVNFKIVVSKEFHFEWHEHLYNEIETCVIRSDMLDGQPLDRLLGGSEIILTTLGMLSNPVLDIAPVTSSSSPLIMHNARRLWRA
ncbi:hypothetical protein M422DRAFT_255635 [Sphaerobolus stellatus SS14]|uniref:DNA2/NAM7 helicase helicase domain-containing protein n=1 Tax=Sphaerobolus stellatus (strain SS14) TaxID=990650 RepID=A0A0C9VIU4_SPHS4|nr:hypothetical protein M422DRAFT_255635 [Sphaerobolus stellatus SS14]